MSQRPKIVRGRCADDLLESDGSIPRRISMVVLQNAAPWRRSGGKLTS
jgi:hypothetical protein